MKAIDRLKTPVYMQKPWKIIKKSLKFPFEEIMQTFHTEYFGCSFAWMLGLALLEHLKGDKISEILMLGIELSAHEYYFQRPTTEYFLGIAQGMGIKTTIHDTSQLLKAPYIYAYRENFGLIDVNYVSLVREMTTMMSIPIQELFERTYYAKPAV